WLLIEGLDPADAALWRRRARSVAAGETLRRRAVSGGGSSDWSCDARPGIGREETRFVSDGEHWQFEQDIAEAAFPVMIFGAGHVGEALVQALLPLGARITWVDSREQHFPDGLPAAVRCISTDQPEAEVADAPAGTFFLVMTHSHAQDFELCEHIFRRSDFAYFGLIGSRSKRASFSHRLVARGLEPSRLADLSCPIGVPGIRGKEPAVIALAVAAELMQVREARAATERIVRTARAVRQLIHRESR
ncbi:MAG: xanthine dehydrogenase accessory protein XdhC, partial [Zoogloea sp.]|nr:xanthine dehydrogenase accessory protein XdhC [Zoogloea sp.]